MNIYTTDRIRNVVLMGHGGAGKTSLVEAMAYLSGITSRMGKVSDGNTVSDFGKEEQKRKFSISTSVVPIEWEGVKINILDTPGFFDFVGEVEEAAGAADAAIIVISGKAGVEVGAQRAWELCDKYKLPRMVFVTDMDIDNASYRQVVEDMTALYGKKIAPFHLPIRENEKFVGYINVVSEKAYRWQGKEVVECEIPEYSKANLQICRDTLLEAEADLYEMLDLRFERCRLCVAGFPALKDFASRPHLRVATKYAHTAKKLFASRGADVEIIKLNGSIELAPLTGLADVIFDIVQSGGTLRANGLEVLEEVFDISARLVANKVSLKTRAGEILPLIAAMAGMTGE